MGSEPKAALANRLASTAPAGFAQSTPLGGGSHIQNQQQQQTQGDALSLSRPFGGLKGAPKRAVATLAICNQSKSNSAGGRGFSGNDDHKPIAADTPSLSLLSQSTGPSGRGTVGSGVGAAPQRIQKSASAGAGSAPASAAAAIDQEVTIQLQALTITATSWTQRESALLLLNDLLLKRVPTPLQVERTVDAVSERLTDPHPRVACACMLVLQTLLQVAPVPLSPRIDLLLPRVFARASEAKRATAGASGCPQEAAFAWLAAVRDVVPADVLLPHLLRCIDAPQLPLRGRLLALDMLSSSAMNHKPSRDVLASNSVVSRALMQRLQQLQRCEVGEGGVEIKRHVAKTLAAVRSAAAAADDDDDCFIRHDAKSTAAPVSAYPNATDAAAAVPPHSLMSLKAQRVTSGALPPPPSISLSWTTSSHQALPPTSISTGADDGFSRSHSNSMGNSGINSGVAEKSCAPEAVESSIPPYLAHRYNPRAQNFKEGVEMEMDRHAIKQDCAQAKLPIASLLPHPMMTEAQEHAAVTDAQQLAAPLSSWSSPPQLASTASAVRPPSPSPSPSSSRQSSSIPSLLDSIALSSAGYA
jgi:hypothetical protein